MTRSQGLFTASMKIYCKFWLPDSWSCLFLQVWSIPTLAGITARGGSESTGQLDPYRHSLAWLQTCRDTEISQLSHLLARAGQAGKGFGWGIGGHTQPHLLFLRNPSLGGGQIRGSCSPLLGEGSKEGSGSRERGRKQRYLPWMGSPSLILSGPCKPPDTSLLLPCSQELAVPSPVLFAWGN